MIKDNIKPNDMDELFDPYEVFKKEYPNKTNEWYEGYRQGKSDGFSEGYDECMSDAEENEWGKLE